MLAGARRLPGSEGNPSDGPSDGIRRWPFGTGRAWSEDPTIRRMRALIVFDTAFGNTEQIARAIGAALSPHGRVTVESAAGAPVPDPASIDLLIVGGPTQKHHASPALTAWLDRLGPRSLRDLPAAAFDTRYRMAALISGSAAGVAGKSLRRAGCRLIVAPESFFVERDRSPSGQKPRHDTERMEAGEIERAAAWAASLLRAMG